MHTAPDNLTLSKNSAKYRDWFEQCKTIFKEDEYFQEVERENLLRQFRSTGIFTFRFDVPQNTKKIKIHAKFSNDKLGSSKAFEFAYAAYSPKSKPCSDSGQQYYIQVHSSTKDVRVGSYVVLHVKTNFPFASFDWLIVSKDIIWNNGRELGNNVHPEVKTFSVVVSPEMSPGFHVIVYTKIPIPKCNKIIADSSYITIDKVSGLHPHKIEFKVIFNHAFVFKLLEMNINLLRS